MTELPTQADIDLCITLNIPDCNAPIIAKFRIASTTETADLITELEAALRIFTNCAYPVAAEINPRCHNWSEAYLDQALATARAALAKAGANQ